MKRIVRMIVFTSVAVIATSLWNKGFIVKINPYNFLLTVLAISVLYYIIGPILKLILLPFNIITLGLASTLVFFLLFYFVLTKFSLIEIKEWVFSGVSIYGLVIPKMKIGYFANIILSTMSVSTIINLLGALL